MQHVQKKTNLSPLGEVMGLPCFTARGARLTISAR